MDHKLCRELADKVGGAFKFTVLLQKRIVDLVFGAAPLVETKKGDKPMDIALREISEGKIALVLPEEKKKEPHALESEEKEI